MLITAADGSAALEWLRLASVRDLPVSAALRACAAFGGVDEALSASQKDLAREVGSREAEAVRAAGRGANDAEAEAALEWLEANADAALLPIVSERFPARLVHAGTAPLVLFVRGRSTALDAPAVAVTGSVRPDAEGAENAFSFGRAIADAGATVIAALEAGDDAGGRALEGALAGAAPPIALLATGPDRALARSAALQRRICESGGLLMTAVFPGFGADEESRARRGAVLATIAPRLLVVCAERNDPALALARQAADAGVTVGAIPGSIHSPHSRGCHRLIRDGAALVETLRDLGIGQRGASK